MADTIKLNKHNMPRDMVTEGCYLIKFTDYVEKYPEMATLNKSLLGMLCNQTPIFKKRIQHRGETTYIYLQPKTLERLRVAINFKKKYNRGHGKTYEELQKIYGEKMPSKNLVGRLCSQGLLLSEYLGNRVYLIDKTQFTLFMQAII